MVSAEIREYVHQAQLCLGLLAAPESAAYLPGDSPERAVALSEAGLAQAADVRPGSAIALLVDWPAGDDGFARPHTVLRPGGELLVLPARGEARTGAAKRLERSLRSAGFRQVHLWWMVRAESDSEVLVPLTSGGLRQWERSGGGGPRWHVARRWAPWLPPRLLASRIGRDLVAVAVRD